MRISMIVAMAKNRVIGCDNRLPWRLPSDLRRFRELTMGQTLLMGRRTFESIGKVLDGRRTIVMSRDRSFRPAGVEVAPDLDAALKLAEGAEHLFICGGEDLFRQGMALAERIYLTEVKGEFGGDCRFPDLPAGRFREIWREEIEDDHDYFFSILEAGTDKSDDKGE